MSGRGHLVILGLSGVLLPVLMLIFASVVLQTCALQSYLLTQRLFPALTHAGYEYWLDWGTLLGAQREGDMIAHDYDADIGMREVEFQRLKREWSTQPELRGMWLVREGDGLYRIRHGLGWVDVFRYAEEGEGEGAQLVMKSMAASRHSCACVGRGHHIARHLILPLTPFVFGSVVAPGPVRTPEYLEHLYGADWRVSHKNWVARLMTLVPSLCPPQQCKAR